MEENSETCSEIRKSSSSNSNSGGVEGGKLLRFADGGEGEDDAAADANKKQKTKKIHNQNEIPDEDEEEVAEFVRAEFKHHEDGVCRINNGSFGSSPACVLESQADWAMQFLKQPDHFYFGPLQRGILESRTIVAKLINAENVDQVSLVDNATTAVATVLQHVAWRFMEGTYARGDAIIMLHYAYGAVKKCIQAYAGRAGARIIEAELPFPVFSGDQIVEKFKESVNEGLSNGGRIRLAVIDHVSSMPSVVVPVQQLIGICRDAGVDHVFVDGAHAIGNIHIDMQQLDPDFYTSNLHKWFFCPSSVAFLYCRGRRKNLDSGSDSSDNSSYTGLHHPIMSHEFGKGLPAESAWVGTRDYSAQLCVPTALQFTERFQGGIQGIRCRNHERVVEMGQMLAKAWNTELGTPPELCSSMIMVALPRQLRVSSDAEALQLRFRLRQQFSVEVPIYYRRNKYDSDSESGFSGYCAYARISHQVYNSLDDYLRFKDAVLQMVAEVDDEVAAASRSA